MTLVLVPIINPLLIKHFSMLQGKKWFYLSEVADLLGKHQTHEIQITINLDVIGSYFPNICNVSPESVTLHVILSIYTEITDLGDLQPSDAEAAHLIT